MKVLFVSSGNKETGISPIVESQGTALRNNGIELDFFSIEGKGFSSYLKYVFRLRKHLRNNRYDIIHAHYGLSGIVSFLSRKEEKLIVSFMGSDLMGSNIKGFPGRIFYRILEKSYKILSICCFDHTIVKSERLRLRLGRYGNITVCPNGVNLDIFYPVDRSEALSFTAFDPVKDNIIFVSDPARREKNFRLAQDAISLVSDNNTVLHTVCKTDQSSLKYYYSSADALILTSFYEGSPNLVKEAMACNCPVVSTDVGDVSSLFGNSEGHFIASGERTDISNKVKLAIEYRKMHLQTHGRERIISISLDDKSIAKKIADIYRMILE